MTFELKTKLNPAVSGPSVHKLERDAFWQWWQLSQSFKLIPKRTKDPFRNDGLRTSVIFLITCPLQLALMLILAIPEALATHKELAILKLAVMTVLVWLIMLRLFLLSGRRHLRIVQEAIATEDGLELKSPFFKKKIQWFEINDVFPVGNIETGEDWFEVDCNNGECFFLSNKLSESNRLIALIESKLTRTKRPSFELNYRLPDGLFDSINMAAYAVLIAVAFACINSTKLPTLPEASMMLLFSAGILAVRWLHVHKIPQLVRLGQSEVFFRTRSQSQLIAMDQVKQIKKLGFLLIVKTRANWFVLFLSKQEPIKEKLMEYRTRLMLEQKRVIT